MAAWLIPPLQFQGLDGNGNPLVNGKLWTYISGTNTPKVTYSDYDKTANSNPVLLDANGRADVFIETGYYKFVLMDENDVIVKTQDKIGMPTSNDVGVPSGGTAGQVLTKSSSSDYDYAWVSPNYIAETAFTIVNNQSSAADVTGLLLSKASVGSAIITYWIKRRTTSTGATNLVEAGMMIATYDIDTETWSLTPLGAGPNYAGVDFSILSTGQVQYVSSNITGTPGTSRMKFKVTSLGT